MKEVVQQLVQEKKLHQKIADKILKLEDHEQGQALNFIHKFKLGINFSQEFLNYLFDISKSENKKISKLLENKQILELANQDKLSHARRMELLRGILRKMRFQKRDLKLSKIVSPGRNFKAIYEEKAVVKEELTKNVLKEYKHIPHSTIDSVQELIKSHTDLLEGKRVIAIAKQKGKWLERCPGTQKHICCNYLVVNNAVNCPFDCTYCYLQAYINNNVLTLYANLNDLFEALSDFTKKEKRVYYRIGTGEFSDSLALDKATGLSRKLISFFASQNNHLLELKTKSDQVDHLLDLDHAGNTVIGWSVNPQKIIESEEVGAVSLDERLAAAKKCVEAGYPVAFHFDPIIYYKNWEEDYKEVVDLIFKQINPQKIAWISLGALRYPPQLKEIIEARFPHSQITLGQLDVGEDKKMRYFEEIRIEIFKKMFGYIRGHSKEVFVYLCMESQEVWSKVGVKNSKNNPYDKYFKFFKK